MRTPRSIDVIGTASLVLSLGLWWVYNRAGDVRALLAFFAITGFGIALEPLTQRAVRRRVRHDAGRRHPATHRHTGLET